MGCLLFTSRRAVGSVCSLCSLFRWNNGNGKYYIFCCPNQHQHYPHPHHIVSLCLIPNDARHHRAIYDAVISFGTVPKTKKRQHKTFWRVHTIIQNTHRAVVLFFCEARARVHRTMFFSAHVSAHNYTAKRWVFLFLFSFCAFRGGGGWC